MKNLALVTRGSSPGSGVAEIKSINSQIWRRNNFANLDDFWETPTFIWYGVASIFREVVFNFGFSS